MNYDINKFPPSSEKYLTLKVYEALHKAGVSLAELKGIAQTIPNQTMLINAITLQEAKDSSAVENIITTQDELYKAIINSDSKVSHQTKEVVNYRKAILMGYELVQLQGFIRTNDILKIQQSLVNNNAGIRSTPGTVLKNDRTGEIVYTPPQTKAEIEELLARFIEVYNHQNDAVPSLISMALLHHQFESIHPFYDGNGRTGRILNILYLMLNDLIDVPILYLSSYIIHTKEEYYRLLNLVNKENEWEDWVIYILNGVSETAQKTINIIHQVRQLLEEVLLIVKQQAPKIYSKELIELLFNQPYSKIDYVTESLDIDRRTATKYLNELVRINILEVQKVGKTNLYINRRLFELLKS